MREWREFTAVVFAKDIVSVFILRKEMWFIGRFSTSENLIQNVRKTGNTQKPECYLFFTKKKLSKTVSFCVKFFPSNWRRHNWWTIHQSFLQWNLFVSLANSRNKNITQFSTMFWNQNLKRKIDFFVNFRQWLSVTSVWWTLKRNWKWK